MKLYYFRLGGRSLDILIVTSGTGGIFADRLIEGLVYNNISLHRCVYQDNGLKKPEVTSLHI